ncbi:MAG: hypothetical protein K9I94_05915 [Bacteroidales bacterium]|nr:hypothetical protein [Bacteroidales bacterium]
MKAKLLLLPVIFCLAVSAVYPQGRTKPAYIVKGKADTIYGVGSMNKDQKYIYFRANHEKELRKVYAQEVDAFRIIDGRYYVSRKITDRSGNEAVYFLEYLVDGELDLFTIHFDGRYFIDMEGKPLLELNDEQKKEFEKYGEEYMTKDYTYLGYLRYYMKDAPQLYNQIDELENLDYRKLIDLSEDYHNVVCDEYRCTTYAAVTTENSNRIGFVTGLNHHNEYVTPQYGIITHLWLPLRNVNMFVKTGFLYSEASSFKKSRRYPEKRFNVKLPVSLQYVFGKGPIKPTLAFGYPTGIYFVSSLQTGFMASVSERWELSFNLSMDAPMTVLTGELPYGMNETLPYSMSFGLFYKMD